MTIAQLKALVKRGESEKLEFKKSTKDLISAMETVCSFLNSNHGGVVIFGVLNDGTIVGQEVSDNTNQDIAHALSKIEPYPNPKIVTASVAIKDGRRAIVLTVSSGENQPYNYDGRSFVRIGPTTRRMSQEEYLYLYNTSKPTLWEGLASSKCKLTDLDRNRIKEVVRLAIHEKRLPEKEITASIPDIIEKFNLIDGGKLTNAAVVLFCKNEDKQFLQSSLKVARFKGNDKSEFLNEKSFRANAFDLYDRAMDFLVSSLPVASRIVSGNPMRVEEPAIPYKVLREAVANALVHRDYSNKGGAVTIAIFDNRVEITNAGALPKGIRLNQLSINHASKPRNPLIANVFYLCRKIEKWGRGTQDMIQECEQVGNPLPIYAEDDSSFSVTFPLKEPMVTIIYKQEGEAALDKLTKRQEQILHLLKEGPVSRKDLMKKMKTSIGYRAVQTDLLKLKGRGLVDTTGLAKAIVWVLKYRT
jgi:ATP-dependent DNA helicase RecG